MAVESLEAPAIGQHRLSIAVGVAAAVGAVALPLWSVGIGWPVTALAIAGAAWTARSERPPPGPPDSEPLGSEPPHSGAAGAELPGSAQRRPDLWRWSAAVAALLLCFVPAVRASGTLAALCIGGAALLGSYALAGGRTWSGVARGVFAVVPAAVAGVGWIFVEGPARMPRAGRLVLAAIVSAVLLLVFGGLFATADPVFADLIEQWVDDISPADIARIFVAGVVAAWVAVAVAYLARHRREILPAESARPVRRWIGPLEWAIPLVLLDALFALFVVVQITVLFGGNDYVLGAGGPDYADFARGGFAQLGIVTLLTLGVVAVLAVWTRRESFMDLGLIRLLGGVLCGLTLVIVASALKRLALYADAYGFTWPRLLGFAGEVWLGLIFVLLLAAGIRLRADWLPRATVAAAVGVLFALVAINPEAVIARTVLARHTGPYPVDVNYLSTLSADALPAILELPPDERFCLLGYRTPRRTLHLAWYEYNLSEVRDAAVRRPASGSRYCF